MSVNIWSNGNLVPIASSGTYVYNMPLGSIIAFSGDNIPVGFLLCDGSTLNKNEYLDLFNVIGYTYGGSNNEFKLPDLRETAIVGVGENKTSKIAAHDIYALGEFKDDQLQSHTHKYETATSESEANWNGSYRISSWRSVDTGNATGRTGTTTHGKQMGVNYIIKATDYKDVPQSALDDSATTTGNVWSAAKVKEEIDNKNNYSTEEIVIGKWIDGKPIYRKVFTGLLLNAKDKWVTLKPIDNEDIIISATWYTSTSIDGRSHTFGHLLTTFYNNNLDITVRGNMVESEKIDTVIIEYTKTTD